VRGHERCNAARNARPLLTRLARGDNRASLSEYLRHEVQDHFELNPVLYGTDGLADDLDACYAAGNQTS